MSELPQPVATMALPDHITVTFMGGGGHEAAWVGVLAFVGTVLTIVVGLVTFKLNSRAKEQELLLGALDFLGGGTQKRAVGIAVSEYYADRVGMKELIIKVL